jgi:hypothetical protein
VRQSDQRWRSFKGTLLTICVHAHGGYSSQPSTRLIMAVTCRSIADCNLVSQCM